MLGTLVVFLIALPQLAPRLAAAGLAGGLALAPVLYRWRARSLTSQRGGIVLFAALTTLFIGLGNDFFRMLAATAIVLGALFAEVLIHRVPRHPSIAAR